MICLLFPSASQLTLIGLLQARAKLSASEYENKESIDSNNHTEQKSRHETMFIVATA